MVDGGAEQPGIPEHRCMCATIGLHSRLVGSSCILVAEIAPMNSIHATTAREYATARQDHDSPDIGADLSTGCHRCISEKSFKRGAETKKFQSGPGDNHNRTTTTTAWDLKRTGSS